MGCSSNIPLFDGSGKSSIYSEGLKYCLQKISKIKFKSALFTEPIQIIKLAVFSHFIIYSLYHLTN